MKRGKFIVLEGIDGAGTSTQAEKLGVFIQYTHGDCIVEREPWPGGFEKEIRDHIERGTCPDEMAVLFTADRIRHCIEVLNPALESGKHVVCDRYRMSTMVYQACGRIPHEQNFVRKLTRLPSFPAPDLQLLLDVSPEVAMARMDKPLDRYERDRPYQEKIRTNYLEEMHNTENCFLIDASRDVEAVAAEIRNSLWRLRL